MRSCPTGIAILGTVLPAGLRFARPALVFVLSGVLLVHPHRAARADPAGPVFRWQSLPPLPGLAGRAGPFAGMSGDALIVAGGAGFAQTPRQGGATPWHDTIHVLDDPDGNWHLAGRLPRPLAYGLSVTTREGVVCAGGRDGERHHAAVLLLQWADGLLQTRPLPDLPRPCAFLCGACLGDTVYAAGGLEAPDATTALRTFWTLDLSADPLRWEEQEPWPGPERMMAVAAVQGSSFFLISGIRLKSEPRGKVLREYLSDGYRYTPGEGWRKITAVPRPVVAAPSPAPLLGHEQLVVLGGDDGARGAFPALSRQRGFPRQVLVYDTARNAWTVRGRLPFSVAGAPHVAWRGYTVVPGGESAAGTGSPDVWAGEVVQPGATLGWLDGAALAGAVLALGAIVVNLLRRRDPRGLQKEQTTGNERSAIGTPLYAWVVVGLLWVVAVLNYVDRQIIYSVFPLLQAELHLSNVQLGLLSSVFLWVYGLLSPFTGFLADRYGRKRIILTSLLVWSLVTWLTGKVSHFVELLGTRALMGVSEACYLPAALALIVSYHGNRTRSLASGLHHSGLYVGVVLGGAGGSWLGERYGWRLAFLVLGTAGVLYVLVLALFLREGQGGTPEEPGSAPLRFVPAIRELAGLPGFGILVLVFSTIATANCVIYTWLPLYLFEHFRMNLSAAGFSATFYLQAASLIGILLGGWLADRWSGVSDRGRLRTQALGLLLAAPGLALVGLTSSAGLLIGALILFGLGRGFYDCNVMPVLCQIARPDLRATGYGVFNLAGCLAGGVVALLAGVVKETVGLGRVFQLTGVLLLLVVFLLGRISVSGEDRAAVPGPSPV
jgi:predicted MFS family arabinose efflux permease/N-acetylneuraminic acid mutarotase